MIRRLVVIYFLFWVGLTFGGFFAGREFLLSSQVAFFSSILILFASYQSYKRKILARLDDESYLASINKNDDDDDIDEDFDLKKEKARLKEGGVIANLKNINLSSAFFPFRLVAYAVLFVGFLLLKEQAALSISGLLIGLAIMPVGAMMMGVIGGRDGE